MELTGAGTADAHVHLVAPGGSSRQATTSTNRSVRIVQSSTDGNLDATVTFVGEPAFDGQSQGLVFEAPGGDPRLVFEIVREAGALLARATRVDGGTPTTILEQPVASAPRHELHVLRADSSWTFEHSEDGVVWDPIGSLGSVLDLAGVAVFLGDDGSSSQPASVEVDSISFAIDPIGSEDGTTPGPDVTAPFLHDVQANSTSSTIQVSWATDENATGLLEYGLTTAVADGSVPAGTAQTSQSEIVSSLLPSTPYFYRITVEDADGNITTGPIQSINTATVSTGGPNIDVWYGSFQTFGQNGIPQTAINILGNAQDPNGLATASFTLNGGPSRVLQLGQTNPRLAQYGDFNVEIQYAELTPGLNQIAITVWDGDGNASTEPVVVDYVDGQVWPTTVSTSWDADAAIADEAQVVDGKWELVPGGVHTVETGYDRLIAIGDVTWTDYEAVVPVTVHGIGESFLAPIVGLAVRWPGHIDWDGSQPNIGWYPLGGIFSYTWRPTFEGVELWAPDGTRPVRIQTTNPLVLGQQYLFKFRAVSAGGGLLHYQARYWLASDPEPTTWDVDYTGTIPAPSGGSLLLIAHHADVTFGDVQVSPLP